MLLVGCYRMSYRVSGLASGFVEGISKYKAFARVHRNFNVLVNKSESMYYQLLCQVMQKII